MTAIRSTGAPGHHLPPGQLPRLVAPGAPLGLQAHADRYGPLPAWPTGSARPAGWPARLG